MLSLSRRVTIRVFFIAAVFTHPDTRGIAVRCKRIIGHFQLAAVTDCYGKRRIPSRIKVSGHLISVASSHPNLPADPSEGADHLAADP
jgi:hypothetical protein